MIVCIEKTAANINSIEGYDTRIFTGHALPVEEHEEDSVFCVCSRGFAKSIAGKEPNNLAFIQLTSAGFDGVPLEYYSSKGVVVANAGEVYSIPIAETVVYSLLHFAKSFRRDPDNRRPRITRGYDSICELAGAEALILGTGSISSEVVKRLSSFDVLIDGYNPHYSLKPGYRTVIQDFSKLKRIASKYRFVISALPDNQDTRGLLRKDFFEAMSPEAIFVNVGRRVTLVEHDLYFALKTRKIRGAVLDMFELVPNPITNPFRRLDNVVVLPGVAAVSEESKRRLCELIEENVELAASGQRLNCIVSAFEGSNLVVLGEQS